MSARALPNPFRKNLLNKKPALILLICLFSITSLSGINAADSQARNQQDVSLSESAQNNTFFERHLDRYYQSEHAYLPPLPKFRFHSQPDFDKQEKNKKIAAKKNVKSVDTPTHHPHPKLAIIIDDIGNNKQLDLQVADLSATITLAILPHTPYGAFIANYAHEKNKEIMLHVPMEPLGYENPGEGALTSDMDEGAFVSMLQSDIDSIPHLSGLNNHMGSLLTQNENAMTWLMGSLTKNNLFFVDSRTTAESVAPSVATHFNIDHISRDVFLDNETNANYIDNAFKRAIDISKRTGIALAIGHPYPATIEYLRNNLEQLDNEGIELVSVSELIRLRKEMTQKISP